MKGLGGVPAFLSTITGKLKGMEEGGHLGRPSTEDLQ